MNHFCTYCDQGYAARLFCLHESLRAGGDPFQLHVLCLDAAVESAIRSENLPGLRAITLAEFCRAEPDYAAVRARRTPVEFIFTATPVLVRYCLEKTESADRMTYLDADLFFFASASEVLARQGDADVGIVPHRFPPRLSERLKYGTYNVAWVSFRRSARGLAALEWWRERCLEWCHDRVEGARFADQGYLDEFPRRFGGVAVLDHPGINAAPWNMEGVRVSAAGGCVLVDGKPLLFYHFQGVRELRPGWFEPGFRAYGARLSSEARVYIYEPYLQSLTLHQERMRDQHGIVAGLQHDRLNPSASWPDRWERLKRRWLLPHYRQLRGELLRAPRTRDCR